MTPKILGLAAILVVGGCSRGAQVAGSPPPAATVASAPGVVTPVGKPTSAPGAERLGTLPAGVGLPVGEAAPDALLHDADGRPVQLRALYEAGPVLLIFYRGGWCPYCNYQVREFAEAWPSFERRGIMPVMVSVDRIDEAARTSATYTIPFPVLSDPDLAALRGFRVEHRVGDEELARLAGFGMDLAAASGRDHHVIAIPSMFLVDRAGVVRWAHADPDYRVRPTMEQVLAALDSSVPTASPGR